MFFQSSATAFEGSGKLEEVSTSENRGVNECQIKKQEAV